MKQPAKRKKTTARKAAKTSKAKTSKTKTGKTKTGKTKAAKKATPGRKATKSRPTAKPARDAVPPAGPVTLDEAKALANAQRPKLAARAVALEANPPASPAPLGAERKKRDQQWREERANRIRDYKATMSVMKRRGARRPRPQTARRTAKAAADTLAPKDGSFVPLQIFAEGDSWFDYPVPFFGGGIIPRLEGRLGVPILNLAKAGDEVRYMLGVEERAVLTEQLTNGCPAGGPWDVLLFSGGGNDIVDNPMALWINDWDPALPPAGLIHQTRFAAALELVRAGYEDLITLRDRLGPDTRLVFQGYDFALPDGRGICGMGPWLKPTFDLRKFPAGPAAQQVVRTLLQQFAAMLQSLTKRPKVTFINGQGTLPPNKSSWHNELHPTRAGFESFADLFHLELRKLYPDRVA